MSELHATRKLETATLGGGCFWCTEAVFSRLRGVEQVVPGYAGGRAPNPTYYQVCSGQTGHAEVVQVTFDPEEITFRDLLEVFFATHDPTTLNRQGADIGPQYRSVILYHTPEQREVALAVIRDLQAEGLFEAPIVTEVTAGEAFYPAEPEHHRYYELHAGEGYCRAVIAPKLERLRARHRHRLRD